MAYAIFHATQTMLRAAFYSLVLGTGAFHLFGPTAMVVAVVLAAFLAILRQISLAYRYPDLPVEDLMDVAQFDRLSGTRIAGWIVAACLSGGVLYAVFGIFLSLFQMPGAWERALWIGIVGGLYQGIKKLPNLKRDRAVTKILERKSDLWLRERRDTSTLGNYVRQEISRRAEQENARLTGLA